MGHTFYNFLYVVTITSLSKAWNYEDQDNWPYVGCQKAVAQSPIDLQIENMTQISMAPLVFINWDEEYNVSVMNNGHTIIVNLPFADRISVSGGGLPGTYNIAQFHFHWGSEHALNGQRQALEAHFVGFNNKFDSEKEAMEFANGVTVLSVMYDYSYKDNAELQPILQQIDKLENAKQMKFITINPSNFLPNDVTNFYRYYGSLTTPNCNDVVVWTIFNQLCKVSRNQINEFRSIFSAEGRPLTSNFRNLQPINGRTVYKISVQFKLKVS